MSAITPVGSSHRRYEPSRIVPIRTSWSGLKPSRKIRKTVKRIDIIERRNPAEAM
jgi:hypothetical protein